MKKIHIFTNSRSIVKILSKFFIIKKIFTQKKNFFSSLSIYNAKIQKIEKLEKIPKKDFKDVRMAISFSFGRIFKKNFIKNYPDGIWNIHPGDLPYYRGRHPISWAFLNNEKKIGISIHIINEKIDRGFLLAKKFVSRTYTDDERTIQKKILRVIPKILKLSIQNFKKKKFTFLKKGKYFPSLKNGIKIKNAKDYSHLYIYNAIKSQKTYGGAIIEKIKFKDVLFYSKKKIKKKHIVINCKNNKKLIGIV